MRNFKKFLEVNIAHNFFFWLKICEKNFNFKSEIFFFTLENKR